MSAGLRLLLIEDDATAAQVVLGLLASLQPTPRVDQVTSLAGALERLASGGYELILGDLELADSTGLATCQRLLQASPEVPLVVLTGGTVPDGDLGLPDGVQDWLAKDGLTAAVLERAIRYARGRHRLIRQLQAARDDALAAHQSTHAALDRLRALESLRAALVHTLVHDMRTPLTAVRGYTELALGRIPEGDDRLRAHLQTALAQAGTLVDLTAAVLDVVRLAGGDRPLEQGACNLLGIVRESIARAGAAAARPEAVVTGAAVIVRCDADLVRRAITALVAEAMRSGSLVHVAVERIDHQARVVVTAGAAFGSDAVHRFAVPFCRLVVKAHGGDAGIDAGGVWLSLPIEDVSGS